jgi:hypothetical protein
VLGLQGKLEMEIAQLAPDEARAFLQEYGIDEPGRQRVIRASYQLLDLFSFFTVGEDEVRAWTLTNGATALEAADAIHTDLARGFIRAEVIPVPELLSLGGLAPARSQGRLRQEGKEYLVDDGDVVHIKFNVRYLWPGRHRLSAESGRSVFRPRIGRLSRCPPGDRSTLAASKRNGVSTDDLTPRSCSKSDL